MNMMDLRSFVSMLRKADNPWQLVQFVASRAAIKLASGDTSPDEGEEAAAETGAAKGAAGAAEEDDETDLLGQQEEEEL